MTPLVRRYIKTSFVFLMAGLLLGGWIIVAEFVLGRYAPRVFITAHVHLLLVGFMLMIVMGVATWMFPRPARDHASYRPALAETVYWSSRSRQPCVLPLSCWPASHQPLPCGSSSRRGDWASSPAPA